jgi:hypothetical protein
MSTNSNSPVSSLAFSYALSSATLQIAELDVETEVWMYTSCKNTNNSEVQRRCTCVATWTADVDRMGCTAVPTGRPLVGGDRRVERAGEREMAEEAVAASRPFDS